MASNSPRITFGMIVLNGEPFIEYNLKALYPFAHEIIVVEGACDAALALAAPDGHSNDGTWETLCEFKRCQDPENKVSIVTACDEGYSSGIWPEKDEMSQAYARRATGDYLWQVDSDEFYRSEDLTKVLNLLASERPDAVSFPMITFWGSLDYTVEGFSLIRDNAREYHRLFAWKPDFRYETHRPPTVVDPSGIDLRRKRWIRARDLERAHIYLYHYSLLFPSQVLNKGEYYAQRHRDMQYSAWSESAFLRLEKPFHVHNTYRHISWLRRFEGEHPLSVREMMADIAQNRIPIALRDCTDVELLLSNPLYRVSVLVLKSCAVLLSRQPLRLLYRIYAFTKFRLIVSCKIEGSTDN